MKVLRICLIIIGYLLISINMLVNILNFANGSLKIAATPEGFGALIGSTIFIWLGILLLYQAKSIKKKLIEKETQSEIDKIGE